MRFLAAAVLFLTLAAAGQSTSHEYLIRLDLTEFPSSLRTQGVIPLQRKGYVWAVRASNEKALRESTESVVLAQSVNVEFQSGAQGVAEAIMEKGGIVTRTYSTLPVIAAIIPTSRFNEIQALPGVKRVRKSRISHAFPPK